MSEARSGGRIVAIGGGKGGVGKTLVSTNLALALAERGQRVLLVDADLGGANAHTVLGIAPPLVTLSDVVERKLSLADVAVATPFPNLRFVSGALDDIAAANPNHAAKLRLLRQLSLVEADVVILDLGAGTSFNTLDFFLIAHTGILVVLPEPTSVENAYRFLKAAFFRRLAVVEKAFGIKDLVDEARAQRNKLNIHTPADLLRAIEKRNPDVGRQVQDQMARFIPKLVLNQARTDLNGDDAHIAHDMASACRRFLGIHLEVLAILPEDEAVRRAVRVRQPLRNVAPDAPIKKALDKLAESILLGPLESEAAA
ncbi:MAG: P-loop NTPase [Deltaproteobacteria bacterium]|nr:P-loop NTPase [Deltaproteobacteria bacterium]